MDVEKRKQEDSSSYKSISYLLKKVQLSWDILDQRKNYVEENE